MNITIEMCRALLNTRSDLLKAHTEYMRTYGGDYRAWEVCDSAAMATMATCRAIATDTELDADKDSVMCLLTSAAYCLKQGAVHAIPTAALAISTAAGWVLDTVAESEILNSETKEADCHG